MTDKIKQCGNCEWWDISNVKHIGDDKIAACYSLDHMSEAYVNKYLHMTSQEGQDCPVYKERNNG